MLLRRPPWLPVRLSRAPYVRVASGIEGPRAHTGEPAQPGEQGQVLGGVCRLDSARRAAAGRARRGRRAVTTSAERHDAVRLVAAAERARHDVRRVDRRAAQPDRERTVVEGWDGPEAASPSALCAVPNSP
jgi:hypothetical protein